MGITRNHDHKRQITGAPRPQIRHKRKFYHGRQPAATKIGERKIQMIRGIGGNIKPRALRLEAGNFSWASEKATFKTRILSVAYHPTSNELVRTNTLTKRSIVYIDTAPFAKWYAETYGVTVDGVAVEGLKNPEKYEARRAAHAVDAAVLEAFKAKRVLACIASRPGQSGRADGYILEGAELAHYSRHLR